MDCGGFGSSNVHYMHQQKASQLGHLQVHLHQAPAMQSRCEHVIIHVLLGEIICFAFR